MYVVDGWCLVCLKIETSCNVFFWMCIWVIGLLRTSVYVFLEERQTTRHDNCSVFALVPLWQRSSWHLRTRVPLSRPSGKVGHERVDTGVAILTTDDFQKTHKSTYSTMLVHSST